MTKPAFIIKSKMKKMLLFLLSTAVFLSTVAGISMNDTKAILALAGPSADAAASIIRVKLSSGDLTEISFSISGAYSIESTPLPSGTYRIRNEQNKLSLLNSANTVVISNSTTLMIRENLNPDPSAINLISLQAGGSVRNYLGSMKFWLNGPYIEVVNHVYLEKYLYGVVAYEMSDSFPLEALKSQAVAARCYAVKRLEGSRAAAYDIGDTSSDQVYKGFNPSLANVIQAVDSTAGKVLTNNGSIITAYFAASNGGQTDRTENVWSAALPYFKIRNDPYDLNNPSSLQKTVYFPVGTQTDKPEDMQIVPSPTPTPTPPDIHYSQDDLDPKLIDFLRSFAIQMLTGLNAEQPDGSKYVLTPDSVKVKAILDMSAMQTNSNPYCRHTADSTDTPHNADNCPSIDFTGVKMTVLLKVMKENAATEGGYDRLDYTWQFQFKVTEYLKSVTYLQWQVFSPANSLRIYAVERGTDLSGRDAFKLINRRYGHGIGLSQRGAQQRAKDPDVAINRYQNILAFYYPNTVLANLGLTEPAIPPLPVNTSHTVTFDSRGGSLVSSIMIEHSALIAIPPEPSRTGNDFAGWYRDKTGDQVWHFSNDTVNADLSLFAKWTPLSDKAKAEAFVTHFYLHCLNRDPDSIGLDKWVDDLMTRRATGADVAKGIVFSQEFQNRHLSNEAYVRVMYKAFFNREPDTNGFTNWYTMLETGMSRNYVLAGFVNSPEFKALAESFNIAQGSIVLTRPSDLYPQLTGFVTRFYNQCLNRMPDPDGLDNWVSNLKTGKSSGADIAYGFVFSPEFQNRKVSNEVYVTIMYKAFFNRDPDQTGYNNWVTILKRGGSRYSVLAGFVNSLEFSNLCKTYGISRGILK